jgi:hypothetical protein
MGAGTVPHGIRDHLVKTALANKDAKMLISADANQEERQLSGGGVVYGKNRHIWGIILAGGEGKRLQSFIRK